MSSTALGRPYDDSRDQPLPGLPAPPEELAERMAAATAAKLAVVPVSFADACAFVAEWHRHHTPPVGHKFSLGVAAGEVLVGVAIVGRPVARHLDNGTTLEVTRSATDGTANANSMLYGAAWRAAKALGYRRLITYTQAGESGASLRAAGWTIIGERQPKPGWSRPSRPRKSRGTENVQRFLWEAST
jgi:hypothetical protein